MLREFSIDKPLPQLVAELNRYKPSSLAGFSSRLGLLAREQETGRLHIHPGMVIAGGEALTAENRARIASAFHAQVRSAYAATECGFLAYGCAHNWLHVNTDWVVLEPVDADYRPVPPGRPSHTVLLSNLANRAQPILRYDMGDNVLMRPDACPCGSRCPPSRCRAARRSVREEISRLLAEHKAEHVALERAEEPPEQSASGKFRRIIPLAR